MTVDKFIGWLTIASIYVDVLMIRLRFGSFGYDKPTWWAACSTAALFMMAFSAMRLITAAETQRDLVLATVCLLYALITFAHASISVIEAMRSSS